MLIINLIKSRKMMITVKTSDICGNCGPDILIFLSGGLVQSDIWRLLPHPRTSYLSDYISVTSIAHISPSTFDPRSSSVWKFNSRDSILFGCILPTAGVDTITNNSLHVFALKEQLFSYLCESYSIWIKCVKANIVFWINPFPCNFGAVRVIWWREEGFWGLFVLNIPCSDINTATQENVMFWFWIKLALLENYMRKFCANTQRSKYIF